MIRLPGNGRSPIGLAIDGRWVAAAQLSFQRGRRRLQAAVRGPRTPPDSPLDAAAVRRIGQTLARQGLAGKRIVLAVPQEKLMAGVLELPPRSSGAPLEQIAGAELARIHGYDPHAAELACWDLPPNRRSKSATQVMAVACRHSDAEALLDVFEAGGMEVRALDSPLHALARACRARVSSLGLTAILDLGWQGAILSLLYHKKITYQRLIPEAAIQRLWQALGQQLNLEPDSIDYLLAEQGTSGPAPAGSGDFDAASSLIEAHLKAILAELHAPFSYAADQYPDVAVDCLLLTGWGAAIPGVADFFGSHLGFTVQAIVPADVIPCRPALAEKARDPSLTVAVGLAEFFEESTS